VTEFDCLLASGRKKHKISKADYQSAMETLRGPLLDLQQQLEEADKAVLIILAGVDGSGKGDILTLLNEWFDPRYMYTHAYGNPTGEESQRPRHWRYWMNMPVRGHLGLEVFGWYGQLFSDCLSGRMIPQQRDVELAHINRLEKTLVENGMPVIKIWLHLTQKQQTKKIRKLASKRDETATLTDSEKRHLKQYPDFIKVAETILQATQTEQADWLILNGYDANYRRLSIARHLVNRLSAIVSDQKSIPRQEPEIPLTTLAPVSPRLASVDLTGGLDKKTYLLRLNQQQHTLAQLTNQARHKGIGAILVFEGWDAAGKGGAIRRLTAALDARNYRVIPIAAPTVEEKAHHYLWRFWRQVPGNGQISLFDRSWYGRVLVERVEGLAQPAEWLRAYSEINEFEQELTGHGILVLKFWLHISKEEQLRRFAKRENTHYKRYKITADDYRNRSRWEAYELAVDAMLARTDTAAAPWHLIAAENKYVARLQVFEQVIAAYRYRLPGC